MVVYALKLSLFLKNIIKFVIKISIPNDAYLWWHISAPTSKINYDNIQDNYVYMQGTYVYMQVTIFS